MAQNGFFPSRLIGISRSWDAESVNDLLDSYGQEWTYDQRKALEYTCHSGFFISVVVVQIATLIVCKTRKTSLFSPGFGNLQLNSAMIIELLLALFLTYTPSEYENFVYYL
jgi:sodium/potassium-transporting ATPase subunit alpha